MVEFFRKLVVVQKQVGGCLIPYNLQLACARKLKVIWPDVCALLRRSLWMATSWMIHSVRKRYRAAGAANKVSLTTPSRPKRKYSCKLQRPTLHPITNLNQLYLQASRGFSRGPSFRTGRQSDPARKVLFKKISLTVSPRLASMTAV